MIGQTISHYKILEKLGEGGMGVVYKAKDLKLKRTVALKFLPPEFTRDYEAKKRFLHEAQAASTLDHPNICNIFEIDETDDGQMFIAMAYYEGETLKDKIEKGPLKINEALSIVIQVAEGLNKAHQKEIVHRDIKSANVLITTDSVVKILDFGLAKLRGQTKLTKEGTTLGTVAYMSPEQVSGEKVDHRSDIWSLGVILYEMVTGQLPFKGEYEQAFMYAIMNEDPNPVTGLRTGVPMELERIINKALNKDTEERYQHADDLLVDLKKLEKDTTPEMASAKYKTPKGIEKPGRRYMIPGIVLLAVLIIVAGYFILKRKPEHITPVIEPDSRPSLAVVYFENKSGDKNLDNWRDAFSELLTTDLSQSKYIRVLRSDQIYGIFKKLNLLKAKRYSEQDLLEIAKRGRVNHILRGSYIKAGENFVITAILLNADSGETISSLSVKAEGEKNIFPKVDELTREIKSKLKLTNDQIASDIDKEVGKITTSSPEAYKYYAEGRKYQYAGDYRKSIQLMEKAVSIDPEFAMPYRSMGASYGNLGYFRESNKHYRKAMELGDRLSDRERYNIQGDFYRESEKTYNKAIKAYNKLLQLYPGDIMGNINLGGLYQNLEEWDKLIERNEVLIRNKEETWLPYFFICIPYQAKGLYEKAREVLEYYLNNFQDHYTIRVGLAQNYIIQRKFDLALSEVEKAISLAPHILLPHYGKGDIYLYMGEFIKAEKAYLKILDFEEKSAHLGARNRLGALYILQGRLDDAESQIKQAMELAKELGEKFWESILHFNLAYIYLISGKPEGALKELSEAWSSAVEADLPVLKVWILYFKAIICLEMKSPDQVQKAEEELMECIKKRMNKKLIRWYYLLMGEKELKRDNFSRAIEYFNKAISLLPFQIYYIFRIYNHNNSLYIDPLALTYFKSGGLDKAIEEYERITSLTLGRLYFGDIYAKAFYQLGKIYQKKGFKGKAIDGYNKFIELWKECDPIFQPLVEDARKRVKELEGKK